ncbi:hypothetical protein F2P56_011628 [Juglans regia]|uniref:Uncharacterized protein n=2 Tax=Juglans regia TaxID=51240 RepID=A0A834CZT8_JUGRE|nr:uncharacterized protein LOC109005317 isoform X2 [Juglans regia]KAF5471170.1 hypothetical protein F2P56_011628 [Juglans regia]
MEEGAVPGWESNKKLKLMQGDGSSSSSGKASELEALRKELEQKNFKIQELKRQIEATKHRLELGKKKVPEEQMEVLKSLIKKYNSIREEHEALLADKSRKIYYK